MILFAAFLSGFSALAIEILGVHLLAPWFGASSIVWSNQIGVVLFAMAMGAAFGGRLARTHPRPQMAAGWILLVSGICLASSIFLLPLFANWLLPTNLRLDEAATIFLGGSFTSALLFFAPPVLILAMVAPLLVELRSLQRGAGRAAGEISAMGTAGSLVGVFGATFLGIPLLGVRFSLLVIALLLVISGTILARLRLKKTAPALFLLSLVFLVPDKSITANLPLGDLVVEEVVESPYQRLRTLRFQDGTWWLQMNEGVDSFQSVHRPGTPWPGSYYDVFSLAPLYANANVTPPSPFKFWTLGHGAGSAMGPLLAGIQGNDWTGVGIELDPAVLELSPPPFWGAQLQIVSGDGRSLLRCAPNDLDLIILDAYSRQFEIPLHLATQEFFLDVSNHLRKGGIFAANLGSASLDEQEQPWLASLVSGLQLSFQDIRVHRVPFSRNIVLFARKDMDLLSLEELAKILPAGFPVSVGAACLPSQTQDFFPNALPFKDDLNPLALWQAQEWFQGARP